MEKHISKLFFGKPKPIGRVNRDRRSRRPTIDGLTIPLIVQQYTLPAQRRHIPSRQIRRAFFQTT